MADMFTGTIEDELVSACERMGYGLDINYTRQPGHVIVSTSKLKRDDHRFKNATLALMWVEAQERTVRGFGR